MLLNGKSKRTLHVGREGGREEGVREGGEGEGGEGGREGEGGGERENVCCE